MTKTQQPDVSRLIYKIKARLQKDEAFTDAETAELHKMVDAWRGWQELGRLAKWLVRLLVGVAAVVASWEAVSEAVKLWAKTL